MACVATHMQALVAAINYNYQVNSLTSKQFRTLWNQLPDILTETELKLSLHHSGLINLAYNFSKFNKLLQIIKKLSIKDDENDNKNDNNNLSQKLDHFPMEMIQHISSFLTQFEFLCKLSLLNRYVFIATQSPSHLTKLDLRYSNEHLTLHKFQEILYNNTHIHWLGVPGYLLKNIDIVSHKYNSSLKHFAFDLQVDSREMINRRLGIINNETIRIQRNQIMHNLFNIHQTLFKMENLIFLEIETKKINIIEEKVTKLLNTCINLQHLVLNLVLFDHDWNDWMNDNNNNNVSKSPSLKLSKLKCLTIKNRSASFGIKIIQSSDHKIEQLNLEDPEFTPDIIHGINELNLTNLQTLHLHLLHYIELYWIVSICCSSLRQISITNYMYHQNSKDLQEITIKDIIRYIVVNCKKLEQLKIKYSEDVSEIEQQSCSYMQVWQGLYEGITLKASSSPSKLQIETEHSICIEQIVNIFTRIEQLYSAPIQIKFIGTNVYKTMEDWKLNESQYGQDRDTLLVVNRQIVDSWNDFSYPFNHAPRIHFTKYENRIDKDKFQFVWTNDHTLQNKKK